MEKNNYLVLLRGINVGGKNTIKMNELKKIFEEMKFSDIETYIQSGNVLFRDYENNRFKLTKKIEKKISDKLENEIKVAILTLSEIKEIINGVPNGFGKDSEKYKYDVIFLIEPLTTEDIMKELKIKQGKDKIYEGKKSIYVKRFAEKLTGSYISEILKISQNITVRNLNTIKKIYELMLERDCNIK